MSRAYRIKVRETLQRVIRAEDHVQSQLELLDVLPADQMSDLLAAELQKQGFEREGNHAAERKEDGVTVTVDLDTGMVTVRAEAEHKVDLKLERKAQGYDDISSREQLKARVREQLQSELEAEAENRESALQNRVTDRLEAALADLKGDLDRAVNRATAEALKQKAAQLGQIKEMTEDTESGSLTIVVEV